MVYMSKLSLKDKINKYYKEHPFFESYKGWVIRIHRVDHKYLGSQYYYTCDVKVGVESCQATHIELVREWIDTKINEGKTQKEDIYLLKENKNGNN